MMTRTQHAAWLIADQAQWIADHGGSLTAYRKRYGDPGCSKCYGEGGTAIFRADIEELVRRINKMDLPIICNMT